MGLLPLLSFIVPIGLLYGLDPKSFEYTWKGRTFYLFLLWLVSLETILGWEGIQTPRIRRLKSLRTIGLIIALLLPAIYVIASGSWGLNVIIVDWAKRIHVPFEGWLWMPLSTEYLVLTVLLALIVLLGYGIRGLSHFSVSILFVGIIGLVYTVDNLYPKGGFTPFQILVPTTARLAAGVLNLLGYQTAFWPGLPGVPRLVVSNLKGAAVFDIAWPCSGVESLLIYAVTIVLFLKRSNIQLKWRIVYFLVGAIVTYFINIWRIVTIYSLAIENGSGSQQVNDFHFIYGQLYSITWIVSYPLILMGIRALWDRVKSHRRI